MMRQRYGRIISVSSVVGLHGNAEDGYRFRVESKW